MRPWCSCLRPREQSQKRGVSRPRDCCLAVTLHVAAPPCFTTRVFFFGVRRGGAVCRLCTPDKQRHLQQFTHEELYNGGTGAAK